MIFFGANDACLPGQSQHVPLDQYCETLKRLCLHPTVTAHGPQILLVTPPPVNEYQLTIRDALKGCTVPQRTAANTKSYAAACRKVGKELNVPVVDLWHAYMSKAGWKEGEPLTGSRDVDRNEILESLLQDGMCSSRYKSASADLDNVQGLHFNPEGYRLMYDEVMKIIREEIPDQSPEKLPTIYPPWEQAPA